MEVWKNTKKLDNFIALNLNGVTRRRLKARYTFYMHRLLANGDERLPFGYILVLKLFIIRICHSKLTFILTLPIEFGEFLNLVATHHGLLVDITLACLSGPKYCLRRNTKAFWSSLKFFFCLFVGSFLFCKKLCKNCQCHRQIVEQGTSSDLFT